MTKFSGSLYGACFIPVLIVGLFMRRRSATAAIATLVVGSISVIVAFVLRQSGLSSIEEVYPGMVMGMCTFTVATFIRRD